MPNMLGKIVRGIHVYDREQDQVGSVLKLELNQGTYFNLMGWGNRLEK